ncbi:MAG TPA: hypothetical protein VLX68_03740 [Chitinivibrionales bacterium]|nr:hypothetical protein [Chitinivibrionales bacterium]
MIIKINRLFSLSLTLMFSALLSQSFAIVYIVTDTLTVLGKTAIVRASSEYMGARNAPSINKLPNIFDNDSTTYWQQAGEVTGEQQWIDIKFSEKRQFKGMIFGAGCRKDYICLEDNTVPTKMKIKLDEKPAFEYTCDWDAKAEPPTTLTREEVNMRKGFIWFDCDTPFTTALIQIKFEDTRKGARYDLLCMSDFELLDPTDNRFDLFDILSKLTINPNDLGVIKSPALTIGDDDPWRIKTYIDSLYSSEPSAAWKQDSAKIEKGLNTGMRAISDGEQVTKLIAVLKTLLIKNGKMVRFRQDGRTTYYMMQSGTIFLGGKQWDIWRYISTIPTSKGIEVTIRYVPFAN